jgi:hypothetical protein
MCACKWTVPYSMHFKNDLKITFSLRVEVFQVFTNSLSYTYTGGKTTRQDPNTPSIRYSIESKTAMLQWPGSHSGQMCTVGVQALNSC